MSLFQQNVAEKSCNGAVQFQSTWWYVQRCDVVLSCRCCKFRRDCCKLCDCVIRRLLQAMVQFFSSPIYKHILVFIIIIIIIYITIVNAQEKKDEENKQVKDDNGKGAEEGGRRGYTTSWKGEFKKSWYWSIEKKEKNIVIMLNSFIWVMNEVQCHLYRKGKRVYNKL